MSAFKYYFPLLFLLLLLSHDFFAQNNSNVQDVVLRDDYEYLKKQIASAEKDTIRLKAYLDIFVQKAGKEKNYSELYHFYRYYHFYFPENKHLIYADSAIFYAKKLKNNELTGDAYYSKAVVYKFRKEYREALNNDLIASDYILKTNNEYLKHKVKYSIANIKLYLGFYEEAIGMHKECIAYFSKSKDFNHQKGLVNSYDGLAICYIRTRQYQLSSKAIALGIQAAKEQNFDLDVKYFAKTDGINEYFKKNYTAAIYKLKEALPTIIANKDIPAETTLYFYIGKCYRELNEKEKAMSYFFKVDAVLAGTTFMTPELRENYEILIGYYKNQGVLQKQLEYVNKLIRVDEVLHLDDKSLSNKMHKEYDTKRLMAAKSDLEVRLRQQGVKSWIYVGMASLLAIGLGVFVLIYYRKQLLYKQKFEALMQAPKEKVAVVKSTKTDEKVLGINKEVVADLLEKLEKFEKDGQFLKKGLTLIKLSDQLKTNSTYLSKVINHYKEKNFTNYINDLRVEYVINLLKTERITQKYTIKALSEMTGFATTQHFSDAFHLKTSLRPSYFIEALGRSQLRVV